MQFKLNRNQISLYNRIWKSISKSKFKTFDYHHFCGGELFTILAEVYNDRLEMKRCNLVEEMDHKGQIIDFF